MEMQQQYGGNDPPWNCDIWLTDSIGGMIGS